MPYNSNRIILPNTQGNDPSINKLMHLFGDRTPRETTNILIKESINYSNLSAIVDLEIGMVDKIWNFPRYLYDINTYSYSTQGLDFSQLTTEAIVKDMGEINVKVSSQQDGNVVLLRHKMDHYEHGAMMAEVGDFVTANEKDIMDLLKDGGLAWFETTAVIMENVSPYKMWLEAMQDRSRRIMGRLMCNLLEQVYASVEANASIELSGQSSVLGSGYSFGSIAQPQDVNSANVLAYLLGISESRRITRLGIGKNVTVVVHPSVVSTLEQSHKLRNQKMNSDSGDFNNKAQLFNRFGQLGITSEYDGLKIINVDGMTIIADYNIKAISPGVYPVYTIPQGSIKAKILLSKMDKYQGADQGDRGEYYETAVNYGKIVIDNTALGFGVVKPNINAYDLSVTPVTPQVVELI